MITETKCLQLYRHDRDIVLARKEAYCTQAGWGPCRDTAISSHPETHRLSLKEGLLMVVRLSLEIKGIPCTADYLPFDS